jgi:carboxyl-terminal processing protease
MTKAKFSGFLVGLVLTVGSLLPLRASDAPSHAYAVLVGISNYGDKQIQSRPHAEADIKALYDLFSDKAYVGVEPSHMHLLVGEQATRQNILKAVHDVAAKAGHDDLVIFAFVGQGAPLGESGDRICYLAADSTLKDRAKNGVAAADIQQELDKLVSQRFCAFIDVYLKGFVSPAEKIPEATLNANSYREFRGVDGKEDEGPAPGRALFLATSGLSLSPDAEHHGLFTQVILDGLKGAADREGSEPDGVVTVDELQQYVDKELPERKLRKAEFKNRHHVVESYSSHFVITRNPAVAAKIQERLNKFDQLSAKGQLPKECANEGRELLTRMPKLKAKQELRREYQQLADGKIDEKTFTKERERIISGMKIKESEAVSYATKIIQAIEILRDSYVKELKEGDLVAWAVRGLYRQIDERLPAEIRDRLDKANDLSTRELHKLLVQVRQKLGKRDDLDNHKDIDYSLQRMMMSHLDPYTTYIDPDMIARFTTETTGKFEGIGISIREDPEKGGLRVVTPLRGSPAHRKGIKAGDLITKIIREVDARGNSLEVPEEISTKTMTTNDAVKKIQGKPGTKVKLIVEREGEKGPLTFEVDRAVIEVESVLGFRRADNDEWNYMIDPERRIAYVRLSSFTRHTARDLLKVVQNLSKKGLNGLILDLRFNPGGLLTSAVEISDMFIDDGLIVTIRPRAGSGRELPYSKETSRENPATFVDFPMVCMVNGMSASGSEIVAACLQDHHRAVIMGERSYGKGSVQNIQPFEGGELKLTTASFWRPSGKNLNKSSTSGKDDDEWGVTPNDGYLVKLSGGEKGQLYDHQRDSEIIPNRDLPPKEKKSDFKDRQLEKALDYLRTQKTAATPPLKRAG